MKFRHLATIFSIIGVLFLAAGLSSYHETVKFLDDAIVVEGKVIDLREIRGSNNSMFKPVIQYTDHDGEQRIFMPKFATNPPAYFKGENLELIYDPRDPKHPLHVRINDTLGLWLEPIGFSAFGAFFLFVVIVTSYVYKRGGETTFGKDSESPTDGYDF